MNAVSIYITILSWAIAGPGILAELQLILDAKHTSDNNNSSTAELRQYTCGTTSPVYVTKGYQVQRLLIFF